MQVQCKRGHQFFGGTTTYACYQQMVPPTLSCGDYDPEEVARALQPWMARHPETQEGGFSRVPLCPIVGDFEGECVGKGLEIRTRQQDVVVYHGEA